jgi:hypothetical protein
MSRKGLRRVEVFFEITTLLNCHNHSTNSYVTSLLGNLTYFYFTTIHISINIIHFIRKVNVSVRVYKV